MLSKRLVTTLLAASAMAVGTWSLGNAAEPFTLSSTTFKDGTLMPKKVANKNPANPNCVGDNVSPQLSWSGAPEGTKSYALTMVDPEGRGGLGVFHWVAYGIPPNVTSFAEGEVSKDGDKFVGGKSTQGVGFYSGPCTPPGSPHHYTFLIIGDRPRAQGAAGRPDAAGAPGEAQRPRQGRSRPRRPVREAAMM